jgi:CheY-like chemotaxis protein
MPVVDGFAAARQIRMQPGGDNILMCALSAYGGPEMRARAKEVGFDRYLQKPANFAEVTSALAGIPGGGPH